jgi:hypothetical protein
MVPGDRAPDSESIAKSAQSAGTSELPPELIRFLELPGPRLLLIRGPTGTGKTTLTTELIRLVQGHRVLITPEGASIGVHLGNGPVEDSASLDPIEIIRTTSTHGAAEDEGFEGRPLAAGVYDPQTIRSIPRWAEKLVSHLPAGVHSYVFVDPWRPDLVVPIDGPSASRPNDPSLEDALLGLRRVLGGANAHLILLLEEEEPSPPASGIDGLIQFGYEPMPKGRIRVLTVRKLRDVRSVWTQYPYTLADGRFRCTAPPPPNSQPSIGRPDPAPEARPGFTWPGSRAYAEAFGWFRHGAVTGLELGPSTPDSAVAAIVAPAVTHVLQSKGRVIWIPEPTRLPEDLLTVLARWVPQERLIGSLRILSAGGDEEALGPLGPTLLPLAPARAETSVAPGKDSRRVAPAFGDALRFLAETPEGGPKLLVLSYDGLRAVAAVTGVAYDPATFPLVVARYAQVPGFHGVGVSHVGDPMSLASRNAAESVIQFDIKLGQLFLTGIRPDTVPHALRWTTTDELYRLIPMS